MFDYPAPPDPASGQSCLVFRAQDLVVATGANAGDRIAAPPQMCPGDVYVLSAAAVPRRLSLHLLRPGACIATGPAVAAAGHPVQSVARCTMMTPQGDTVELLLLRPVSPPGPVALLVLPLSPLVAGREHALVKVEPVLASTRLGDPACLSLARGTRVTRPTGTMSPVEALAPGDLVMTRDRGPQPLRWVGRMTLRATGGCAPVVIARGALGSAGDLALGQQHRLFLYRRDRGPGRVTAETLVQARHMVDGAAIRLREGGFVEYFCLAFDEHEIIYAEGLATESLLVTEATLQRMPDDLAADVMSRCRVHRNQHFGTELGPDGTGRMPRQVRMP